MKTFGDALPVVTVPVRKRNPLFGVEAGVDYYLPECMVEAEVLMLNVNAGTMRCRPMEDSPKKSWHTQDFCISHFFNAFSITKKRKS